MKNWCYDWIWIRMKKWLLKTRHVRDHLSVTLLAENSQKIWERYPVPNFIWIDEGFRNFISELTWMKWLLGRQLSCCLTRIEPQPRWVGVGLRRVPGQDCLEFRFTWVRLHHRVSFLFPHQTTDDSVFFISCHVVLSSFNLKLVKNLTGSSFGHFSGNLRVVDLPEFWSF